MIQQLRMLAEDAEHWLRFLLLASVAATTPCAHAQTYTHNAVNGLTVVKRGDGATMLFEYDQAGNLKRIVRYTPWGGVSQLPDTGVTWCYRAASNELIACNSAEALSLNVGQDGMVGNDIMHPDGGDGRLGFTYSKIDADGTELPPESAHWVCVKDKLTGLTWEVKTADGGLRDMNVVYTNWGDLREGDAGHFVHAVNQAGLCGARDWRLPAPEELQGLIDYGAVGALMIDPQWFPNSMPAAHWSDAPFMGDHANRAWQALFNDGVLNMAYRSNTAHVRLVRR